METLTFWQQLLMALAHGGPPCVVAYLTYRGLRAKFERHLNGGLENRITEAVKKALEK